MSESNVRATGVADDFVAISVFPQPEDHLVLQSILKSADWPLCPGARWTLKSCATLQDALSILKNGAVPVVLAERDLQPGTWKDVLAALDLLNDPPFLIVTSKQADDRLWAEALNLGAYDVLPAPLEGAEVRRTLSIAALRWNERRKPLCQTAARSAA